LFVGILFFSAKIQVRHELYVRFMKILVIDTANIQNNSIRKKKIQKKLPSQGL